MEQVKNEQTIYSAAVYCRLSKDDEQAGESISIETQKMMLTDFCHERGFSIYEIYADDGYSGLNFNRPAFTRLLEDIDSGTLATVTDSASGTTATYGYDHIGRPAVYKEQRDGVELTLGYSYYVSNKQLKTLREVINGHVRGASYIYDDDTRLTSYQKANSKRDYTYDGFDRVSGYTTTHKNSAGSFDRVLSTGFTFASSAVSTTSGRVAAMAQSANGYGVTYSYTYDANGNILSVSDGTNTTSYAYDSANQLVRENNQAGGFTHVWTYDRGGNILSRTEYAYTTGALGAVQSTVNYSYGDSQWGDLLTTYGTRTISSDGIGNTLSDGKRTYTWEHGRQLATLTQNGITWRNTYNAEGLRTGRTDGTNTYAYVYYDGLLQYMEYNGQAVYFTHAPDGTPMGMLTEGNAYFYITNLQGDVVALLNSSGMPVVQYTYDAWGNLLSCTGSLASTIGALNPIRYRGYVYDTETQLYYLQSRYYDPEIGRFINADAFASTGQGFTGNNMFAYCLNNPTNRIDYNGEASVWHWLIFDHDMGFIHRAVQKHILINNPGISTEVKLENGRRADIVLLNIGAVWEVKHESVIPQERQAQALRQANDYLGKETTDGHMLTHLGSAHAFEGDFIISIMDETCKVYYYTPQAGVVLYRVTEMSPQKAGSTVPFAVKNKTEVRIGYPAILICVTNSALGGGPVLGGLFAGLVSCER